MIIINSKTNTYISALLFIILTSCTKVVREDELVGLYVNNNNLVDSLVLRCDGTCEFWTFVPGQKLAFSGKWTYHANDEELKLVGVNFPLIKESGELTTTIKSINGKIMIVFPELAPYTFQRVE